MTPKPPAMRPGPPLPTTLEACHAEIIDLRVRLSRQIDMQRVMEPETADMVARLKEQVAELRKQLGAE
jgi:hypothetical protein